MIKQRIGMMFLFLVWTTLGKAQTFSEAGPLYQVSAEGSACVVSGFTSFENVADENVYAKALLWTIENICPWLREGITEVNPPEKSFSCNLVLASGEDARQKNTYYCRADFRVAEGKLLYRLSEVLIESEVFVMKKVTPLEKLTPEKKVSHRQTVDDFVEVESSMLNRMFDFIATYRLSPITHWPEICMRKPVKGMTEEECRLAFGKPQTVLETGGEVQWMYTSSFYLFFKDGRVKTIIK